MVHAAAYDAVNAIERSHAPYLAQPDAGPGASMRAAAAQAAYRVASALYPARSAAFDATLAAGLAAVPDPDGRSAGVAIGEATASAILAARADDGSTAPGAYNPGSGPGQWRPTPPGFNAGLLPQWPGVRPFALADVESLRAPAPPALGSPEYAAALAEVQALGAADSAVRTPDQTQIALFWADNAGTATPPGHWNRIAADVVATQGLSLPEEARLFALLNLAMADAGIAAWDSKYAYDFWRPETAIRLAELDGNPSTFADPTWTPLMNSPPFPTYVGGHSTFSGAAAEVLVRFFGTDAIAFTSIGEVGGGVRSYTGFREAAGEAGRSRIYGGIHFEFDNQAGLALGRAVGASVFDTALTPVPEPGALALLATGLIGLALLGGRRPNG